MGAEAVVQGWGVNLMDTYYGRQKKGAGKEKIVLQITF
jgi:hypothetical protein